MLGIVIPCSLLVLYIEKTHNKREPVSTQNYTCHVLIIIIHITDNTTWCQELNTTNRSNAGVHPDKR
jgi:hypothetical protein